MKPKLVKKLSVKPQTSKNKELLRRNLVVREKKLKRLNVNREKLKKMLIASVKKLRCHH